jgi:hypothetical protein
LACAHACSTSALYWQPIISAAYLKGKESKLRLEFFVSVNHFTGLARDFGTQLKYSKLTQLAQKFCACRAIIGPNFIGSAYRKQRIYGCEKENSSLTSVYFSV